MELNLFLAIDKNDVVHTQNHSYENQQNSILKLSRQSYSTHITKSKKFSNLKDLTLKFKKQKSVG